MSTQYCTGREGEFIYCGYMLDELQEMELGEVAELLPARQRRTITQGLSAEHEKLLAKVQDKTEEETANVPIRMHLHDMSILPEFVGFISAVYTGQEFEYTRIQPEMIGHYLGEFQLIRSSVEYGRAGIGAARSPRSMPFE